MSVRALKPRIDRLSPAGTPPSPAWKLMPVTLRSTSRSVVAPCSLDDGARDDGDRLRDVAQRLGLLRRVDTRRRGR